MREGERRHYLRVVVRAPTDPAELGCVLEEEVAAQQGDDLSALWRRDVKPEREGERRWEKVGEGERR